MLLEGTGEVKLKSHGASAFRGYATETGTWLAPELASAITLSFTNRPCGPGPCVRSNPLTAFRRIRAPASLLCDCQRLFVQFYFVAFTFHRSRWDLVDLVVVIDLYNRDHAGESLTVTPRRVDLHGLCTLGSTLSLHAAVDTRRSTASTGVVDDDTGQPARSSLVCTVTNGRVDLRDLHTTCWSTTIL